MKRLRNLARRWVREVVGDQRDARSNVAPPAPPQPPPPGTLQLNLSGRVALVTGATGELGRVISRTLAQCGADVAVHYHRNRTTAEQLQAELEALGGKSCIVSGDVGAAADVTAMAAEVRQKLGEPDIVVINAVEQIHPWTAVLDEAIEDYESQFRSTVLQTVHIAKAFLPSMVRRRYGRLIGINTECTMQMQPRMSAYVAGKRGMDGVFRVLAREVGPDGITVNQVAPGWTVSERSREKPEDDAAYVREVPLRRRGTDQEIANAVAFLASDLASFVHGVYLPVTGGNVMPTV